MHTVGRGLKCARLVTPMPSFPDKYVCTVCKSTGKVKGQLCPVCLGVKMMYVPGYGVLTRKEDKSALLPHKR